MQPASTSQDALSQLQQTQANAKSATDLLTGAKSQYGVQGAQDTVSGLRGAITNTTKLLNQVAPSVMGRTANSLVTNAQATRQVANEQQPIAATLSQQGQDYSTANSDYSKVLDQATQQANLEYGDQQNKVSYAQNLYNTLFGREQAAAQAAQAEADRQEKIREFNAQLAAAQKAASAGAGAYLGGSNAVGATTGDPARAAAIEAEARRQASISYGQQAPALSKQVKQATANTQKYSGLGGLINYIGEKGPMALLGF